MPTRVTRPEATATWGRITTWSSRLPIWSAATASGVCSTRMRFNTPPPIDMTRKDSDAGRPMTQMLRAMAGS